MSFSSSEQHLRSIIEALAGDSARITLSGLKGSAPAYILTRIFDQLAAPLIIITPDPDSAAELYNELNFYSGRPETILHFPAWDAAPFENASTHPDITGKRLNALFRFMDRKGLMLVAPCQAAIQKVIPRAVLGQASQYLVAGEDVDRDGLVGKLVTLGYSHVPLVEDQSTFSVRGGIIDIFPPNLPAPVRIEFFGDFVDTIRTFDPITQRSLHPLEELVLLPAREVVPTPELLEGFASRLKKRCDDLDLPVPLRRELLEQLQNSIYPPGIDYLQPLFHPRLETIFDYAGPEAVTVLVDPFALESEAEKFFVETESAWQQAQQRDQITPPLEELYLWPEEFRASAARGRQVSIPSLALSEASQTAVFAYQSETNSDLKIDLSPDSEGVLKPLVERLQLWLSERTRPLFACHQLGQAQRLYELLAPHDVPVVISDRPFHAERDHLDGKVAILVGELSRGFRLPEEGMAVIAEEEVFGKRVRRRGVTEARKKQLLTSLAELKPGDHIVHIDHGVALYRGLQHLALAGIEGDFLLLEYAGGDKLYLPVDRISLVQRYVGAEGVEPKVDKLGGTSWEKTKGKARAAIQEMAEDLLKIYAAREIIEGFAFSPPDDLYREFEAAFAFEETPDQLAAIEDVLRDMQDPQPMDRLICGDVGYGKTEVALRGVFKAVMDGKQVAVLVPTTVLAQQHLETFTARLKAYPVNIEMLSRFRSPREQKAILERLNKGEIDIIIGTHRLLQKDVGFKDLGLVIVDEEQRFGVAHKERLKQFRAVVDVMTLTATPIPRTLHMSLLGIRDLSIIDTPPVDRLAVKTFVARFNDELIREAVLREVRRGGQVFFVHNRVQSIGAMAEHLGRIVPEAKIAVAHGQMDEKDLERIMLGFMHGEYNLLLCTTIIESGLDIPNANTLVVNRADTFGLAQLYQLRGRVGRSRQRAYSYFLIPGEGAISSDARERLKILQELTELGAGFRIATHDLEIRGAGDLLGARQSGQIAAVGFELYTEMLEEAIRQMRGEELVERVEPEIKLRIPAFIPEDYVPDPNQRLVIYKKLTQAQGREETDEIQEELTDRYGKPPLATTYLLQVMRLRISLKALLVKEIEFDGRRLVFAFHQKTPVSPDSIIALLRSNAQKYQFTPDYRLSVELADTSFDGILAEATNILKSLSLCGTFPAAVQNPMK